MPALELHMSRANRTNIVRDYAIGGVTHDHGARPVREEPAELFGLVSLQLTTGAFNLVAGIHPASPRGAPHEHVLQLLGGGNGRRWLRTMRRRRLTLS
jgi:hypothetical protein